jgi:DNA-binding transcriptional ArsR family regulator
LSTEEDTYTTIFKAMQHPIRRRILRALSAAPASYTEILRDLNIDNGLLNYHLDALSTLITKDKEEKYTLSEFGRAAINLIRGVEEPDKTKTVARGIPAQLAIKALAAVLAIAFIVSAAALIDTNNKYFDLAGRYSAQGTEITRLQTTLNRTQASLNSLNATLTSLEKNPLVKAATMIISRVGIDYFNEYFHDPTMQVTSYDANTTKVVYRYRIGVGEYMVDRNVSFYFHYNDVMSYGIPLESNLQPFNVTKEEAIRLAVEAGLPDGPYELEAEIFCMGGSDVYPLQGYEDKYIWEVTSWNDPPWARDRTERHALVDPSTGQVYSASGRGGRGLDESKVDTAAEAKAQGIDGYVKLDYPELPQQFILMKGSNITFTLRASFTSYNSSLREVRLTVDPYYVDPYQIQWNLRDKLRDYIVYEPSGVITLRDGESIDVVATLRVPDGGQGITFNRYGLDGLGIGVDGVLIVSDLEV